MSVSESARNIFVRRCGMWLDSFFSDFESFVQEHDLDEDEAAALLDMLSLVTQWTDYKDAWSE